MSDEHMAVIDQFRRFLVGKFDLPVEVVGQIVGQVAEMRCQQEITAYNRGYNAGRLAGLAEGENLERAKFMFPRFKELFLQNCGDLTGARREDELNQMLDLVMKTGLPEKESDQVPIDRQYRPRAAHSWRLALQCESQESDEPA